MIYALMADAVVLIHFGFILFAVLGGLLVLRWSKVAWVHVPAFIWAGIIGLFGWICPLTYLENDLRAMAGQHVRGTDFVEHFLMPIIYPELLFPDGFPEHGFLYTSLFVLGLNVLIYGMIIRRRFLER